VDEVVDEQLQQKYGDILTELSHKARDYYLMSVITL
jgi:hypothetical protein